MLKLPTVLNSEIAVYIDGRLKWHTSTVYPFFFQKVNCSEVLWGIFTLLKLKNDSVFAITCPFPLHKHRGTPTGLWGHWFFSVTVSVSLSCSLTHPPRPLPGDRRLMKTSRGSDMSCCILLCLDYVLSRTKVSTERDELWSRQWCVLHLCGHSAQSRSDHVTLGIFFTYFCGLILQSLLKPICFAHLLGNSAFILIASQFKCGLCQIVPWSERA